MEITIDDPESLWEFLSIKKSIKLTKRIFVKDELRAVKIFIKDYELGE